MRRMRAESEHESSFDFVHEAVRSHAQARPGEVAIVDENGNRVTYGALASRAQRLARRIRAFGVRPDAAVAVYMERSVDWLVSMLAIFEAGAAYAPIDTAYPDARVVTLLENLRPALLLSDRDLPASLAGGTPVIASPRAEDDHTDAAATAESGLDPEHLAYVIHTSGSTGAPKGVAMSHRGLSRLVRWQIRDGERGLSTLQFSPLCFDVALQEVFSTLCDGGMLVLAAESERRDAERLLVTLQEKSIQRLFLPYVALQQLATASLRAALIPGTLRHVITAGERLIVTDAIARFFSALPDCRFDNHYGPTEAHLVTRFTLRGDPASWPALPPIGAPVAGSDVYCLDDALTPAPAGEAGELYVGGEGVARGYVGAPALSAERFLPDPYSVRPGARMYKTGDVGRVRADGVIEFVGRADDQLKVRGFRVEPAEVERQLTRHPRVRTAAVGLRTIAEGVDGLVAYVATDGGDVAVSELSGLLRATLPAYMVPSRFVFVDALPLTASGKVDRVRLSALELPPRDVAADSGAIVDVVRAIWARVLGHDEFGDDEDFFDVGGDSLLATWVVTELSQAVGRRIELSAMLDDATVKKLARALDGMTACADRSRRPSEILTLRAGPSQRALYLCHPLGGELIAYRELARAITSPLRVLGLGWRSQDHGEVAARSLEEMARVHVEQLRSIQPNGPYLLAGWSFGGVLAFEIAQQLRTAGERVDFLGLIDANPILDPITGEKTSEAPHADRLTGVLNELDRGLEAADVKRLLADPYVSRILGPVRDGVTASHLGRILHVTRDSLRAAAAYVARPYDGTLDLFQASGSPAPLQEMLAAALHGLSRGTMHVHAVPGDHSGMLRAPHVDALTRAIDDAIYRGEI